MRTHRRHLAAESIRRSPAYTASLTGHAAQIIFFIVSMILARTDGRVSVGVIVAFIQLMRNIIQLAITMPELIARVKAAKSLMRRHDELLESCDVYREIYESQFKKEDAR